MYCLDYVYTGQITRLPNSPVLMYFAYRLPPSPACFWNKAVVSLRIKTVSFSRQFASGSAPKRKYGQDHTSFGSLLFTWSSLAFSQQILHPQTTSHALKPHARACKTPTQFLAINTSRKWAATQPSHYYTCTELRKKVNLFISRFKAQRMLWPRVVCSTHIVQSAVKKTNVWKLFSVAWPKGQGLVCSKNVFDFVEVTPMLKEKRTRIAQQPDA